MKLRRIAKHMRLRMIYTATAFSVITLSFAVLFSNVTEGAKVVSPGRYIATVSTHGKTGVTSPEGVSTKATSTTTAKSTGSTQANTGGIPTKPAWVSMPLYVDPTNGAAQYLAENPSANGAAYIARMAKTPVAQWFGDWNANVKSDANRYVSAAGAAGAVPVLVAYNIPHRDCGGYSVGGADGLSIYTSWIQQLAAGIGGRTAVVILEPDALGALDCLPASLQQERTQSIAKAVTILKANSRTSVYIDAGTPSWQPVKTIAARLKAANVAAADGFSINVSYFAPTSQNKTYGDQVSALIGNKHYVIDTSRNGGNHNVTYAQCNPSFASFGDNPTTNTGSALIDALLWIKIPWESDGPCNGSPDPGQDYWDYAILLAQNAGW